MTSASWHRVLFPGLLFFGLSLPLSKSASNVLLAALALAALAGAWRSREFRDDLMRGCRQPLTAALAIFCLVAYAGIVNTGKASDGFSVANKFISLPAVYVLVSVLLQADPNEEARARKAVSLLVSFLAGVTALNLLGMLTFLGAIGTAPFTLPLAPLGVHHIWFSNINAIGVYTAAAFLLFPRQGAAPRSRVLLGCFLGLAALGIALSTSRTAWFGIALTAMIMAAVIIRNRRAFLLAVLLCALTFACAYLLVPFVHQRIDLIGADLTRYSEDRHAETSIGARFIMWDAALRMFKSHPFVGVGTGDFVPTMTAFRRARLIPKFLLEFNQPHNMYFFSMATNGIAGLAALLFVFYRCLRSALPALRADGGERHLAFLAVATTVHFMIAGVMDSFFNIQILRYGFAFIMGVCIRGSVTRGRHP